MAQHNPERRIDVERLRLGSGRTACGGIAHVSDACVSLQGAHMAGLEYVLHQPVALVHVKGTAIACDNPRSILPTMLQHQQTVIKLLVDRVLAYNADNSTHKLDALIVFNMLRKFLWQPRFGR